MKVLSVSRMVGKCEVHVHQSAEGCLDVAPLHIVVDSVEPWNRHARSKLLCATLKTQWLMDRKRARMSSCRETRHEVSLSRRAQIRRPRR